MNVLLCYEHDRKMASLNLILMCNDDDEQVPSYNENGDVLMHNVQGDKLSSFEEIVCLYNLAYLGVQAPKGRHLEPLLDQVNYTSLKMYFSSTENANEMLHQKTLKRYARSTITFWVLVASVSRSLSLPLASG